MRMAYATALQVRYKHVRSARYVAARHAVTRDRRRLHVARTRVRAASQVLYAVARGHGANTLPCDAYAARADAAYAPRALARHCCAMFCRRSPACYARSVYFFFFFFFFCHVTYAMLRCHRLYPESAYAMRA